MGRKPLLLLGGVGMLVSIAGAATVLLVFRVEEKEGSVAGYVTVALICFFVFNFAYGWGYARAHIDYCLYIHAVIAYLLPTGQ